MVLKSQHNKESKLLICLTNIQYYFFSKGKGTSFLAKIFFLQNFIKFATNLLKLKFFLNY